MENVYSIISWLLKLLTKVDNIILEFLKLLSELAMAMDLYYHLCQTGAPWDIDSILSRAANPLLISHNLRVLLILPNHYPMRNLAMDDGGVMSKHI